MKTAQDFLIHDEKFVYPVEELIHTLKVGRWCQLPYPNHPRGCPNFGEKEHCPPRARYITDVLDVSKPMFVVHSTYDLLGWSAELKRRHPQWSPLQCRCVLYWQKASRKQLKERALLAMRKHKTHFITLCPEGMGVNVYVTCLKAGLKLEMIKNLKTCHHIALIGHRKKVSTKRGSSVSA